MKLSHSFLKILPGIMVLPFLIFLSCEPPTEAETTGDISGTIYDSDTSLPLSGVTITTDPITSSKITDSNGSFKISGVEPGEYSLQAAKAGYETNTITINVVVGNTTSADLQLSAVSPELSVPVTNLDFSTTSTSQPFTISNTGEGTLEWSVTENSNWITINPASGSVTDDQASVTVYVDRSGLESGDYSETVTVTSNGGSAVVQIDMTVEGPVLILSNNSLNFGTVTETLTFTVTNGGVETINYNTVYSAAWLTVNPSSGSATTETDVITVTVDRSSLTYGNYFETITVTSNANSATVDIMMTVPDPNNPQLSAYPNTIDFGERTSQETFSISNTGSGLLTWNITDDKSWIAVDPQSGTTQTEADEITVTVDRLGMSPGTYTGTINISSDGGNQNVNVSMIVPDEPSLAVSTSSLNFGTSATNLTFTIANAGAGSLEWTVSDNQDWISTNPTSGTNFSTVNVSVARDGNPPGDYSGVVSINSNGGTGTISVAMWIPADDPPSEITLLDPTNITESSMTLSWTRNFDSDFAAYKVYRDVTAAVTQNSELVTTITSSSDNSYIVTGLQPATAYYFRVYVMDTASQHSASNIVGASTLAQMGTWSLMATLGPTFLDVDALNDEFAFAVGKDGVIYYYDGEEWEEQTSPTSYDLYDVEIISQTDIWAVGASGVVCHYDGINWSTTYTDYLNSCIEVVSENEIYVGSGYGRVYHFDGSVWTYSSIAASDIRDIHMHSADSGWLLDEYGKVFYYNGYGWSLQHGDFYTYAYARKLHAFNSSDIWITSSYYSSPQVIHWDGTSWTEIDGVDMQTYEMHALSPNSIWFAGGFSTSSTGIFYWNGNDIQVMVMPTTKSISGLHMMSETDGWAVGYGGVILRYH